MSEGSGGGDAAQCDPAVECCLGAQSWVAWAVVVPLLTWMFVGGLVASLLAHVAAWTLPRPPQTRARPASGAFAGHVDGRTVRMHLDIGPGGQPVPGGDLEVQRAPCCDGCCDADCCPCPCGQCFGCCHDCGETDRAVRVTHRGPWWRVPRFLALGDSALGPAGFYSVPRYLTAYAPTGKEFVKSFLVSSSVPSAGPSTVASARVQPLPLPDAVALPAAVPVQYIPAAADIPTAAAIPTAAPVGDGVVAVAAPVVVAEPVEGPPVTAEPQPDQQPDQADLPDVQPRHAHNRALFLFVTRVAAALGTFASIGVYVAWLAATRALADLGGQAAPGDAALAVALPALHAAVLLQLRFARESRAAAHAARVLLVACMVWVAVSAGYESEHLAVVHVSSECGADVCGGARCGCIVFQAHEGPCEDDEFMTSSCYEADGLADCDDLKGPVQARLWEQAVLQSVQLAILTALFDFVIMPDHGDYRCRGTAHDCVLGVCWAAMAVSCAHARRAWPAMLWHVARWGRWSCRPLAWVMRVGLGLRPPVDSVMGLS